MRLEWCGQQILDSLLVHAQCTIHNHVDTRLELIAEASVKAKYNMCVNLFHYIFRRLQTLQDMPLKKKKQKQKTKNKLYVAYKKKSM